MNPIPDPNPTSSGRNPKPPSNDPPTDVDLVVKATSGDPAPFVELFDRHAEVLYRYVWSLVRSDAETRRAVRRVFLLAWRRRSSMRFVQDSALPWLLATSRPVALRSDGARRHNPAAQAPSSDELETVFSAIAELSVADQQLCWLCIHEGKTYAQAASRLNLTPGTVGRPLERFRRRLRVSRSAYREVTS